ncbi:MAG: NAD(P)/FAD-dependent oxidoreductase [Solirubrobacteraceae bacterium]
MRPVAAGACLREELDSMADQPHAENILSNVPNHETPLPGVAPSSGAPTRSDYDVAVVGASLAGCATAIMLARSGARIVLVEKSPDPHSYKKICTHYIQSSAVPTLERLGMIEPMMQAGAVRSDIRSWTRWGWIEKPRGSKVPSGINLRRERLDPLIRELARKTPGVELLLGHTVQELLHEGERVSGVRARDSHGQTVELRARLVVGADGRDSRVAKLSGVHARKVEHGRIAYGGYYEGPAYDGAPASALWLLDPNMVGAFPTDSGHTFYAVMPTKEHLPEFRADAKAALEKMVSEVPDAPPILTSRLTQPVQGKVDMTNVMHTQTAPGLALVGDAAGALDPLWGIGCGFALQTSEWLADSVAPALGGAEPLERGLKRYRRRHARGLGGHTRMILDYADGRKISAAEKFIFSAASYDERTGRVFEAFGTRNIGPVRMLATGLPLAGLAHARRAIGTGPRRAGAAAQPLPAHPPR